MRKPGKKRVVVLSAGASAAGSAGFSVFNRSDIKAISRRTAVANSFFSCIKGCISGRMKPSYILMVLNRSKNMSLCTR